MFLNKSNFQTKTSIKILIFTLLVFLCNAKEQISNARVIQQTSNFQPVTSSTMKISAANAINVAAPKDGLNKRNVKVNDLSDGANKVAAKSYDPPPEFYRGPGSTTSATNTVGSSSAAYTANLNKAASSYITQPIKFPDTIERGKYTDSISSSHIGGKDYNKRQLQRGTTQVYGDLEDRVSVGHYGSADHSTTHGGSSASYLHGTGISSGYGSGYSSGGGYGSGYDAGRPYHNDYDGGPRYPVHGGGGGGGGAYYIGSHSDEAGGIPFDVYGSKGHYAGAGGEYSYSSYPEVHEAASHKGHGYGGGGGGYGFGFGGGDWQHKALLAKSFLIPLASAAVLGVAAAFASNPLLLQLGTVSGPAVIGKRRKRRDLSRAEVEGLTREQKHSLAYRRYDQRHDERRLTRV